MKKVEKYKYSKLQYVLWLVSGSEISILKNCPSDYNRHAGIGFTILMTSLFGAFAGGYAGFYFTHSLFGAVVFGLLWGVLIFSIDRTMVVSMKKKPGDTWKNNWGQIFARAILAALIAFIISIPLELLVFKDNIDAGLSLYKVNKQQQLANSLDSLYKPGQDSVRAAFEGARADSLQQVSLSDPKDESFKQLIQKSNNLASLISNIKKEGDQLSANARSYLNESYEIDIQGVRVLNKESPSYRQYLNFNGRANKKYSEARPYRQDKEKVDKEIENRREQHRKQYQILSETARDEQKEIDSILKINIKKIDSTGKIFESELKKIDNSFSVRFDVMTFLAKKRDAAGKREYPSVFFLLWLIRILFFVVEILPTVAKVMTPFGAYDMSLYEEEQNLKEVKLPAAKRALQKIVEQDNELEREERIRQQRYRAEKEGQMHDELVDRIMDAQNRMANKILDDWEKQNGLSNERDTTKM